MLTNYHTHTKRCLHASEVEDEVWVGTAVENGYGVLGFSDHCPWPYTSGYVSKANRMPISELEGYLSSVEELKERYRGKIRIELGLECEYFPKFYGWLRELAPRLDYMILGNHFGLSDEHGELYYAKSKTPELVEEYTAYTIAGMGSGLFSCLAHPDLPFGDFPLWNETARACSRMICREALALDMPLEYNLYGTVKQERGSMKGLGYPAKEFWKLAAELGCTAIIGVDAHKPEHLADVERISRSRAWLESLGMKVLEELPL